MRFCAHLLPIPSGYPGTAIGVDGIRATANGTRAAHAVLGARHALLGVLQNAQAARELGEEVHKEGKVALEDLYAQRVIGRRLQALGLAPQGMALLAANPSLPVLSAAEAALALGADVAVWAHGPVPRFLGMRGEGMVFGA
ncbi:2-phosphosulfolactate phosphatase [Thermus arciformis]|uniref:2-phosphosulfolactate phosphatase n=1 Tax=Thermus arciformis TaxID=482827 RepID=A0A1G7IXY9_9DEIN|nr:hypothetical protein [Thermus arciformis]SDF17503.1 2-phosphosulfolactate phosphatase [Thermus arciformis]